MVFRFLLFVGLVASFGNAAERADVVVYGGTPGGVMSAVAAARHGHTVALIDINRHIGDGEPRAVSEA